ncbi:MAG: winged helix-turn-helix domain-containing protein [Methylacidiphilales bacterium]|nr:winged helix-turn-helix domain-containing protein [Candidatus Methylacidiphilales bacterium]NJR18447.1 winged helix-turn-helix domain-containing protein [Calothrix sp. CSU_2_0]
MKKPTVKTKASVAIADVLNTTRVTVTRMLKEF